MKINRIKNVLGKGIVRVCNPARFFISRNRLTLFFLNLFKGNFTILDLLSARGDSVLVGIVCDNFKKKYPRIKINCITKYPEMLANNPNITYINKASSLFIIYVEYNRIMNSKDGQTNILKPIFDKLNLKGARYQARVYLTNDELQSAKDKLKACEKKIITINTCGDKRLKDWYIDRWQILVDDLKKDFEIIQLGRDDEPELGGVIRFAGKLTLRESVAVLACAHLHVGVVSFLMHAANGVGVQSVILYGGRETPRNSAYAGNRNIYIDIECSPCWINPVERLCSYDRKCMKMITPQMVLQKVRLALAAKI